MAPFPAPARAGTIPSTSDTHGSAMTARWRPVPSLSAPSRPLRRGSNEVLPKGLGQASEHPATGVTGRSRSGYRAPPPQWADRSCSPLLTQPSGAGTPAQTGAGRRTVIARMESVIRDVGAVRPPPHNRRGPAPGLPLA